MNSLQPEAWSEGGVFIACGVRLHGSLKNVTGSRIVPPIKAEDFFTWSFRMVLITQVIHKAHLAFFFFFLNLGVLYSLIWSNSGDIMEISYSFQMPWFGKFWLPIQPCCGIRDYLWLQKNILFDLSYSLPGTRSLWMFYVECSCPVVFSKGTIG